MRPGQIFALIIAFVVMVVLLFSVGNMFENVDAGEVCVIQSPVSGKLAWYMTPGIKWQGFGKVTQYKKRMQFWFSAKGDQGDPTDDSLKIRFNDGGNAHISGGLSWEMPLEEEHLTLLHTKFGSIEAIDHDLIRPVMEKSVFMSGPHMSSTESYAGRRSELLALIEDQAKNGILSTRTKTKVDKDPLTGLDRTITAAEVAVDDAGKPVRSTESPLIEYAVKTDNYTVNSILYEDRVEEQIKQQQQSTMAVQIAIADAKRAEQQLLTTKKEGEATAAKAEWEQKTIAAKTEQEALMVKNVATTKAEQELAVAELGTKAAEQKKLADIAIGEGESERRKLAMAADGALEKKLEALVQINQAYATAIGQHQGNWVPTVVMGSGKDASAVGATGLIDLLTAKTARDLAVDLSLPAATSKEAK